MPSSSLLGSANANVELKLSDASGNPYLALAMVIAAGLAGIEEGLTLADPIAADPGTWSQQLAGCPARPLLRLETLQTSEDGGLTPASLERVAAARDAGSAALKTVVAYRGGLDLGALDDATRDRLTAALQVNRDTGDPLPVQIHTGFGDSDLLLPRADPSLLKPLFERFADTNFVLLHCYPFVRQAGWLASVCPNVFIDLSLTIPHVSRPAAALAEALELAPLSKLLYASDAVRTPELYLLAARWWRDALAEVLGALLSHRDALRGAELVLRENALALYCL